MDKYANILEIKCLIELWNIFKKDKDKVDKNYANI